VFHIYKNKDESNQKVVYNFYDNLFQRVNAYIYRSGLYEVKKQKFVAPSGCFFKTLNRLSQYESGEKLSEVKMHVAGFFVQTNSLKNERIAIIDRNINFVRELASRAYFKDNFILIKN